MSLLHSPRISFPPRLSRPLPLHPLFIVSFPFPSYPFFFPSLCAPFSPLSISFLPPSSLSFHPLSFYILASSSHPPIFSSLFPSILSPYFHLHPASPLPPLPSFPSSLCPPISVFLSIYSSLFSPLLSSCFPPFSLLSLPPSLLPAFSSPSPSLSSSAYSPPTLPSPFQRSIRKPSETFGRRGRRVPLLYCHPPLLHHFHYLFSHSLSFSRISS